MFYIYHIPGKKIGCTKNLKHRIQYVQGYKNYQILEIHTDINIASKREIELQKEYGYKRDNNLSYQQTLKISKKGAENSAKKTRIPILCYEYISGKFLCEYESIKKASTDLNIPHPNIIRHLSGITKQCKGYTFEYKIVK